MSTPSSAPRQRGLALIAVLWISVLISAIAGSFMQDTRTELTLARNRLENAKAEALADAGVAMAIYELLRPAPEAEPGEEETPSRFSAEIEKLFEDRPDLRSSLMRRPELQAAVLERPPSRPAESFTFRLGEGRVRVEIEDEAGKIDLNQALDPLLQGLLTVAGLDDAASAAVVDAIADFRDPDSEPRPDGAEDDAYAAAGLAWGAKDAPFTLVEELLLVLGMRPELFERIAPALTVHSGKPGINPWSAPRAVLLALPGASPEQVDALLAEREGGVAGAEITALPWLLAGEDLIDLTESTAYGIRTEARTRSGAVFVREAVVVLGGPDDMPYAIAAWERGRLREEEPLPAADAGGLKSLPGPDAP